ncbi:MAG: hypothetical protein LBK58_07470 [Prevotellaceae bacterium]|jgi:hypothetical protein|nr:hypothetical protein [Prevotellaceae bacterium]
MIPSQNDLRILFEEKPGEYIDLYRDEIYDFITPDEDDDSGEFDEIPDIKDFDAEELFEILFTIPVTTDDDYCELINILADEYLPYDVDADYEDGGLTVVYIDDDRYVMDRGDSEYDIIRKFNEIIKPEYETRVLKMSLTEDNVHSLLILQSSEWKELEAKYGEEVAEFFEEIDKIEFIQDNTFDNE